jgi:hypothetical protein
MQNASFRILEEFPAYRIEPLSLSARAFKGGPAPISRKI